MRDKKIASTLFLALRYNRNIMEDTATGDNLAVLEALLG